MDMRKLLTAMAAVAAMVSGAAAADIEPVPEATGFDWTGFYVGAHGGYLWGDGDDTELDGPFGGVNAGYLFQSDPWVFGIGADLSFADIDGEEAAIEQGLGIFGSVHGRLGFAFDRFQLYGLGGVAIADGEFEGALGDDNQTHVGWVAGAGAEYALTDMFTIFAEYRHWDFGQESYDIGGPSDVDVDLDADSVMGGLRILF